ncbi:uncharacterized protein LOC123228966 [Mangifera indica]|uniref:uncharacterized protein LOC123228966 n=1 Tax=Mangifera indica TaxID=29780 RepID=UPI001CFBC00A|nr:uncharacterized protein LOC123228966 [Mangifera indica]
MPKIKKQGTNLETEREMGGIGGPLLTIGDLLSDVGEENVTPPDIAPLSSIQDSNNTSHQLDLTKLFQENYDQLNKALSGSDHSWTALTLKLCTALETANKLVHGADTNVKLLSKKVGEIEKIIKRGDYAIAAAKAIQVSLNQKEGSSVGSQFMK